MRYFKIICRYLIVLLITEFVACRTSGSFERNNMYVMVYDYDSSPLQNVEFYVDDKLLGRSDIYGRFIMPIFNTDEDGLKRLVLKKSGYMQVEDDIVFDPMVGLYYRMGSVAQLKRHAEEELDAGNFDGALRSINNALQISSDDDGRYLKAIILWKKGDFEEMESILGEISNKSLLKQYSGLFEVGK